MLIWVTQAPRKLGRMNKSKTETIWVVFLRGINVGGHHKVPMQQLRSVFNRLGMKNITTVLNSGNLIFHLPENKKLPTTSALEKILLDEFGFPIPVILVNAKSCRAMLELNPFKDEIETKDTRWYVSFLKQETTVSIDIPWTSGDGSFRIIHATPSAVFSVLDLSVAQTTLGMNMLEKLYGKEITTRNWNTLMKLKPFLLPE